VRDEYRLRGMLAYHPQHDPWKHRAPTPRPDYAVLQGTTVVALLDAKYMDLWGRQAISQDVLYQLAIYALSQPLEATATILYPTTDATARDARIDINDPVHGGPRAHVVARPVNLDRLEACIAEMPEVVGARKRAAYARVLVFDGA